jgi:hypothetical protein
VLPREAPDLRRAAEPAARTLKTLAALALAAGLLAGCGEGGDAASSTAESTAPSATGGTELIVTLDPDGQGGKPPQQQVASCPGSGGDVCDAVAALPPDPAAETPANAACTQIYGGPDTLVLEGQIDGEAVNARIGRSDGCEIDRFDRFMPLLKALFPGYEPGKALGA